MDLKSLKSILENYVQDKYNKNGANIGNLKDLKASVFLLDPEFRSLLQEQMGTAQADGTQNGNNVDFSKVSLGDVLNNLGIDEDSNIDFSMFNDLAKEAETIDQNAFDNLLMQDNVDIEALNNMLPECMKMEDLIGNTPIQDFKDVYNKQASDKINDIVKEKDTVNELLDQAYANPTVLKAIDKDGDGVLSDEEKKAFEDYIRSEGGTITENDVKKSCRPNYRRYFFI